MSLVIRCATNNDREILYSLLEDARMHKESLGDHACGSDPFTNEEIMLRINSQDCYLAEIDGVPVGSIMLT